MSNPLIYLLFAPPGPFLVVPLLSVAAGWLCARWMTGVSHIFSLLTGCAVGVAVETLMWFRLYALEWAQSGLGVDLPWASLPWVFFLMFTLAIGIVGILTTVGICLVRRHQRSL